MQNTNSYVVESTVSDREMGGAGKVSLNNRESSADK